MDESKKCWELLNNIGFDIGFRPEDYPNNRWIYALNDRGMVYSVSLNQEEEYRENYWAQKRKIYFRELFAPSHPLSEDVVKSIVSEFQRLGATNEDTGLNHSDLEKETKIEIGHCYDLVESGVLGVYRNRFYLNSKEKEIHPKNKPKYVGMPINLDNIFDDVIENNENKPSIKDEDYGMATLSDDDSFIEAITKNKPKPIKVDNKGNYL